jgi:hypothetical protein
MIVRKTFGHPIERPRRNASAAEGVRGIRPDQSRIGISYLKIDGLDGFGSTNKRAPAAIAAGPNDFDEVFVPKKVGPWLMDVFLPEGLSGERDIRQ